MSELRPLRVASTIQRALQEALARGLADPRIQGVVTISDVRVSADLRHATVRVSIYPEEEESLTMHGLRSAARHLQHAISDKLELRRTPALRFELDRGLKAQAAVLRALAQERQRSAPPGESDWGQAPEGARNT